MGALMDFLLDYFVVVQVIQTRRAQGLYVWGDVIVEIVTQPFLGNLSLMRQCRVFLVGVRSSIIHAIYPWPHNPLQRLLISQQD